MCTVVLCISFITTGCGSEFEILLHEAPRPPVVFWSEASGEISRINPDGTGRKIILTSSYIPLDIAADSSNDRIFWTEHAGTAYQINRAGIDGSGSAVVYTTASSNFGPSAISIDNSCGIIYWNEYQTPGLGNNIWYEDVSKSGILFGLKLLRNIGNNYTYAICVDYAGKKIYCTANSYYSTGSSAVVAGLNDSGAVYTGYTEATNDAQQVTSLNGPSNPSSPFKGIAVDSNGGHVYYVTNTPHGTWPKNITRTNLNLQNPEVWIYQSDVDIQKIAIDFKQRKIYWTSESDNRIYRADLDSSNSNVEKFIDLESSPTGITILQ
jgi:hypothetical protein